MSRAPVNGVDAGDDGLHPLLVQADAIGVTEELGPGGGCAAPPHNLVHAPWVGPVVQQAQDHLQQMLHWVLDFLSSQATQLHRSVQECHLGLVTKENDKVIEICPLCRKLNSTDRFILLTQSQLYLDQNMPKKAMNQGGVLPFRVIRGRDLVSC